MSKKELYISLGFIISILIFSAISFTNYKLSVFSKYETKLIKICEEEGKEELIKKIDITFKNEIEPEIGKQVKGLSLDPLYYEFKRINEKVIKECKEKQ